MKVYLDESAPLMRELAIAEWKGIKVDTNVVKALFNEIDASQNNLLKELRAKVTPLLPMQPTSEGGLEVDEKFKDLIEFNPLSPKQLKLVAFLMGYGDKLIDKTSPSGFTTSKNVLLELADQDEFFAKILKYRNNQKLTGTYLENVLTDLDADGKVRYGWLLHGTETGRLSNRFFHQMPKVNEDRKEKGLPQMRDMLVASPGYRFVYGDFSQVELRILAIIARDREMIRIFKDPNADIHRATAAEILGLPETGQGEVVISSRYAKSYTVIAEINKTNRTEIGKRVNFGLAYGSEGFNLVHTGKWVDIEGKEHRLTWDMLNQGMRRWKKRFFGIAQFIDNIANDARLNRGVVSNVFGRKRRFGTRLNDANEGTRRAAERELVNFPIQSTAGALTNRTIIAIGEILDKFKLRDRIWLVNTVHDSMMYEVEESLVPWFKDVLVKVGGRPIPELQNERFPIDVGEGDTWTEAES
jgi:DNA polymerase-1